MQTTEPTLNTDRFVTGPECYEMTSLSRVSVKRWEDEGRFPKRITLCGSRVVWRLSEIQDWMKDPNGWPERNAAKLKNAA
ncbi:MAG: AlpA family phage regulatory protein [Alphaproteobacteria bacterium]|nr:AlpA family phage regulatory protein [Alphaproteobacteria bacterium]